jgi:hypothetical protein
MGKKRGLGGGTGTGPVPQAKSTTTVEEGFQSTVGTARNAFTAFDERPVLKTEASYVAARSSKCAIFFLVKSDILELPENQGECKSKCCGREERRKDNPDGEFRRLRQKGR